MKPLESYIRTLSKNNYYQTIYAQEKNLGIYLFKNRFNLTAIQISFLGYLSFYSSLYFDYAMGEIDDMVFEDIIYEDAYMYFRRKDKTKTRENLNNNSGENSNSKEKNKMKNKEQVNISRWVFKTPEKVK